MSAVPTIAPLGLRWALLPRVVSRTRASATLSGPRYLQQAPFGKLSALGLFPRLGKVAILGTLGTVTERYYMKLAFRTGNRVSTTAIHWKIGFNGQRTSDKRS